MQLRDIFAAYGLDLRRIAVCFHVSDKPRLHKALPALADAEPDLFDAFQDQHGPNVEATLKQRDFMASFVMRDGSEYVFAGMFEITGHRFQTMAELDADPRRIELRRRYGDISFQELGARTGRLGREVFSLRALAETDSLVGRLIVSKPPRTRVYRFVAENLESRVVEITRTRQLVPPAPEWNEFIVNAADLAHLPRDHALRLQGWRGVYLITDERDGSRYVGSAYGQDNLLGRWRAHVARELGVTAELGMRETSMFRFSILQLLTHDAEPAVVQAIESNWKIRLHTRDWGLNRN